MDAKTKKALRTGGRSVSRVVMTILKTILTVFLVILTTAAMLAVLGITYISRNLDADLNVSLENIELDQSSFIYYIDKDTGQPVEAEALYSKENRVWATYSEDPSKSEIPQHMVEALIAIEDKRFYSHKGVDWARTANALLGTFFGNSGKSGGGSTITQQLIKNITGEKDITVKRKLTEILRAQEFEKKYTKEKILEWYLNTCYFGQSCWGVKTAAEIYFGKELNDLTLAESACIIGITNAPTRYDPLQNPENNKERQELILKEMFDQGRITETEYNRAVAQKLVFTGKKRQEESTRSFFMDQVFNDVVEDLMEQLGTDNKWMAQQLVYSGGYHIYTTIDMDVQRIMDEVFADEENIPKVKGLEKPQCAMVVMDPYTGNVLGMVGGLGEKQGNLVFNRATQARRQPGSSIKPIAVYAPAMEYGLITPYSVIDDVPFSSGKRGPWPRNSGGGYRGLTTVLQGVTQSRNTIAVQVMNMLTPQMSYNFMTERIRITSLVEQDIDYAPLALGGLTRGVSVLEMTAAYCMFPNHGVYTKPRTYTLVIDSNGETVLDNRPQTTVAIQEKNAWYMNTCLQNVVRSGTGSRAKLANGQPAAGKTGTTTDDYDRWFVGYTPYYCGGAWFGFDDPKKIALAESTNPALAMWKLVMDRLHEDLETKDFFTLENTKKASYCLDSGMAPSENCKLDPRGNRVASGVFYADDVPRTPCTAHTLVNACGESGYLATPYCPQEGLRRIALLDISRKLPVSGVSVNDDGYRVRSFGEDGGAHVATEAYHPPNSFCPLHATPDWTTPLPDEEPDPDTPVDPNVQEPPTDGPPDDVPTDESPPPEGGGISATPSI